MTKLAAVLAALSLSVPALAAEATPPASSPRVAPAVYAATASRLADFYVGAFAKSRTIYADALLKRITAGEHLLLVDIRSGADYANGHLPGAVNIPLDVLFRPENLERLPTDGTPIVLICHTGHTASMAMGGLAALGYDAWVLRFSMMAWLASSPQKILSASQTQQIQGLGGPLEK